MNEATPTVDKKQSPLPPPKMPERHVPASLASGQKRPESIPVRLLRFASPIQVPGDDAATNIKCDATCPATRKHWRVNYIPALRHHEIYFYPAEQNRPVEVAYVHEALVATWWPA